MFANSGPGHWLVLGVVMVLMSALSKLPEAARYGGKSLRILKSELHELHTDARWPRNRSPRPPRSRWGGSPPLQVRRPPNQHRRLTVTADPPGRRSAHGEHPTVPHVACAAAPLRSPDRLSSRACNPGGYL